MSANEGEAAVEVVDLSGVEYLDSMGLGVLIGGLKRAREHDRDVRLICNNIRMLRIFEITGLTKIFDVCGSESKTRGKPD
jgi:anti-sigma B factor antagonist